MPKKYKKRCKLVFSGEPYTKSNALKTKANWKARRLYTYYDPYIVEYERSLKDFAQAYCEKHALPPYGGLVRLRLTYYLSQKKVKDLQNLPKTTCDALIGSIYKDDNQVCEIIMRKLYDPDKPRVVIEVDEILEDSKNNRAIYPVSIEQGEVDSTFAIVSRERKTRKPRKKPTKCTTTIQSTSAKPTKRRPGSEGRVAASRSKKNSSPGAC